jgi:hypothetical protein
MQQSPGFSSFRSLLDKWDENILKENKKKKEKQDKVKNLIDGKNLIMFFRKGDSLFGAPEESRIVFARMKNPDSDDMPEDWGEDASFSAFDLVKGLGGDGVENLFSLKDLPDIDVVTRDEIENSLMKCPCEDQPELPAPTLTIEPMSKFGVKAINLKDRK